MTASRAWHSFLIYQALLIGPRLIHKRCSPYALNADLTNELDLKGINRFYLSLTFATISIVISAIPLMTEFINWGSFGTISMFLHWPMFGMGFFGVTDIRDILFPLIWYGVMLVLGTLTFDWFIKEIGTRRTKKSERDS